MFRESIPKSAQNLIFSRLGYIRLFLCGLCMGTADAIPGISGGTVAFVMGFYDLLIGSLKNPLKGWRVLIPLISGIATAFLTLAGFIHAILKNPAQKTCLYGLFFGLILVSIYFCCGKIRKWNARGLTAIALMSAAAYFLTVGMQLHATEPPPTGLLVFSGFLAAGAMLLPGISGTTVMVTLGVYPSAMASIHAVKLHGLQSEPLMLLGAIAMGVFAGAICFTRVIQYLLEHFHDFTMACLIGFMIGALPAVWPFSVSPAADTVTFATFSLMIGGFFAALLIENWVSKGFRRFTT